MLYCCNPICNPTVGHCVDFENQYFNPLTPNDLYKQRTLSPLKIKIPSKNMCEKPTNATIIHSVN
jgi:hypothetical protein